MVCADNIPAPFENEPANMVTRMETSPETLLDHVAPLPQESPTVVQDIEVTEPAGVALTAQNMGMLQAQEMEAQEQYGTETLRHVFDSMATNDRITVDQLPFVLVGAEIHATAKEIEDAIDEFLPDADDADALLDFQQVETLFHHLLQNSQDAHLIEAPNAVIHHRVSLWTRLKQWYHLRQAQKKLKETAFEKQMKPTSRLLLLILCTSTTISVVVVAFSIAFSWMHSSSTVMSHVLRDVKLMKQGMDLFGYQKRADMYRDTNQAMASLMGLMIEELGYKGTRDTLKSDLAYQQKLLSSVLDGWFEHDMDTRVSTNVAHVKGILRLIIAAQGEAMGVQYINEVNPTLPAGHEIVLSKLDETTGAPYYLTELRYASQCPAGTCGSHGSVGAPTKEALKKNTGTLFGNDYRSKPVIAGYTYLPTAKIGVVYQIERDILRKEFSVPVTSVVENYNQAITNENAGVMSGSEDTHEMILAEYDDNKKVKVMTSLHGCDDTCMSSSNISSSPVALALQGNSGIVEVKDFDGSVVFEAYGPMPASGLGLALKAEKHQLMAAVQDGIATTFNNLNKKLDGTKEVQLAMYVNQTIVQTASPNNMSPANASRASNISNTTTSKVITEMDWLTEFKFQNECEGGCDAVPGTSQFMHDAIETCSDGVATALDYRLEKVTAGYGCSPSMGVGVALKVDHRQIVDEGIEVARIIATHQNTVRFANSTVEFIVAKKKPGVDVPQSARDYDRITVLKLRNQCRNMTCTGPSTQMVHALRKETGTNRGPDYRNVMVVGAYTYVESLDVGVVVKVDATEAEKRTVTLAWQVAVCSISAVVGSMLILAFLTNHLLKSMDEAWDEGKKAVEREKQQFFNVIQAMYPPQVAKQVLAGETRIVYNISNAAVFFSDIYEFTATSNGVTPEELIQFMGYTFGVMDAAAEYFHVYKVKTIGDAYLSVTGLPGSESLTGDNTYDMMLFASCCAQLFSTRYIHPEDGAILGTAVKALFQTKQIGADEPGKTSPRCPSQIRYSNPALNGAPTLPNPTDTSQVQCIMRYGVAAGPITAGVLEGKTPLFDIWGKTVNLASRMESTGQPGRVQVTEAVHHALMKIKDQPFMFDTRHKVFCKGFGSVSAYFTKVSSQPPPRELLAQLQIEPNLGRFYFDTAVAGLRTSSKGTGSGRGSSHESSSGHRSNRSSVASGVALPGDTMA